ncbi:MAG: HNH endonuclease [Candidatus Hydrogenedentes bacterium]|nr:HNH endonuclease [Candidatus Hydrogenedentota bacterium]
MPEDLRRRVLFEAGHRCAVHTCKHTDVDVHHIIPYAQCQAHEFDNLIALCPNCHRLAEKGKIDKRSLYQYKVKLSAYWPSQPDRLTTLESNLEPESEIIGRWKAAYVREEFRSSVKSDIDIEYPIFDLPGIGSSALVNAPLDAVIKREIAWFLDTVKSVWDDGCFDEDGEAFSGPECFLIGRYDIAQLTRKVLSGRLVFRAYPGSAYSHISFHSFNYRLAASPSPIGICDIFSDPTEGLRKTSTYCLENLTRCFGFSEPSTSMLEGITPDPECFTNFNLHRHGFSIDFSQGQLGCTGYGAPSVFVPYEEVETFLNAAWFLQNLRWSDLQVWSE